MLDLLGLIAALALLALPVLLIWLVLAVRQLRGRVNALEARLQGSPDPLREPTAPVAAATPPAHPPETEAPPAAAAEPLPQSSGVLTGAWETGPAPGPAAPRRDRAAAFGAWLRLNWVYAVSALSLALAGVFFVQYGIENGLLPPAARVLAALLFGLALIGAGEWVRRRAGDDDASSTAYIPSTFAGAGIVSVFGGIVAARQLYGLIGPELTFAGLLLTALGAVALGWRYGPFLAAVGLLGATLAPFLVGGASDAVDWLYGYFVLIAGIGLVVDTIRRWAWVSVLSLVLGTLGGGLIYLETGNASGFSLLLSALAVLAVLVPARGILPDHDGATVGESLDRRASGARPAFPTVLAGGMVLVASVLIAILDTDTGAASLALLLVLAGLGLALTFWSRSAPALSDLALMPTLAFLARLAFEGRGPGPLAMEFAGQAIGLRPPESGPPATMGLILAVAAALSLGFAFASGRRDRFAPVWAADAALAAPLAVLLLELLWHPALVLGPYVWALHVLAVAALMVAFATRFARDDDEDRRRVAYATLSALSLLALALFLITTKGALTLALAALLVVAAALDRRFRLPEMGWFIQAGVLLLGWRLIFDPGLAWAIESAALWEVFASYGGVTLASLAALSLLRDLPRAAPRAVLESGGASAAALLANVLITRWLTHGDSGGENLASHWGIALNVMPWLIVALAQLYRMALPGWLRWVRMAVAAAAGLIWAGGTITTLTLSNPVAPGWSTKAHLVRGPLLLDTLFVAYALPGIILLVALRFLGHLHRWARLAILGLGAALVARAAALEIRRFWRGPDLSLPGVTQAELYSYTVALMLLGAGLLYQAIARRSDTLRRIAMGVIALTIAKVFLIDASGLTGLTRVFSFLALGLSLAGLAWLNRWAAGRGGETP